MSHARGKQNHKSYSCVRGCVKPTEHGHGIICKHKCRCAHCVAKRLNAKRFKVTMALGRRIRDRERLGFN